MLQLRRLVPREADLLGEVRATRPHLLARHDTRSFVAAPSYGARSEGIRYGRTGRSIRCCSYMAHRTLGFRLCRPGRRVSRLLRDLTLGNRKLFT